MALDLTTILDLSTLLAVGLFAAFVGFIIIMGARWAMRAMRMYEQRDTQNLLNRNFGAADALLTKANSLVAKSNGQNVDEPPPQT